MADRNVYFDRFVTGGFRASHLPARADAAYSADYGDLLPRDRGAKILDFGCGTGAFLCFLEKRGYAAAAGIDISGEMLELAKRRTSLPVHLCADPVKFLGDRPCGFDAVFMNDVIEHISIRGLDAVLRAIRSSLRPGGMLVTKTGNAATLAGLYLRHKDVTHTFGFTEHSLSQVLRVAGFQDVTVRGNRIPFQWRPKRMARHAATIVLSRMYRLWYLVESGQDGPTIFSKLLIGVARAP